MQDNKKTPSLVERYALPALEIEPQSFAIIDALLPTLDVSPEERQIVRRVVHTTGDPSLAEMLRFHPAAVASGKQALQAGCTIVTDVRMVKAGISQPLARQLGCLVCCAIDNPQVAEMAQTEAITRSIAAMRWMALDEASGQPLQNGAVVAIGNAPTALLSLLDLVDSGLAHPALVVGVPVGFVAAAESKQELMKRGIPYITIPGTRGGSPIAVAIVNALLRLSLP
jgi:precorrin-8X/cobalt-precorrin-8 methylmutase